MYGLSGKDKESSNAESDPELVLLQVGSSRLVVKLI